MTTCVAVPFSAWPPEKLADLVSLGCEHRPWFTDDDWTKGEVHRRALVIARFSDQASRTWEVYRDDKVVGILQLDEIVPKQDARAHFLFRDRSLADKRRLCWNTMRWAFDHLELHVLRLEIPTYAAKLLGFVRKALGFRFESEARTFSWPSSALPLTADEAKLGSRKHQALFHQGAWHDLLLLSLTNDEFRELDRNFVDGSHPVARQTV